MDQDPDLKVPELLQVTDFKSMEAEKVDECTENDETIV